MPCPRCQHENPSGQKFCGACGTSLTANPSGPPAPLYAEITGALSEALEQQKATAELLQTRNRDLTEAHEQQTASGSRVLDVAAGTGEQTLLAARRVGPTGSVLATDIAAEMLTIAAETAHQAGLGNVTTHVMDARQVDVDAESFDAAICRLGLMFIPDLSGALAGIRRVLRSGGKFATIVVSSAEKNPYIALPLQIACGRGRRPVSALDRIGLFSLGSPAVLQAVFTNAGFCNVTVHAVPTHRWYPSRAEALEDRKNSCPEVGVLMADLIDTERERAWSEIEQAIGQFEGPNGVEVSGEVLVAAGTK